MPRPMIGSRIGAPTAIGIALLTDASAVLVWPEVVVGVAQRAVTVQFAFDELIGGGGHASGG